MISVRHSVGRDLFPGLVTFIGGGVFACAIASLAVTEFAAVGDSSRYVHAAWSAGLGGILGLFLGLSRAVWHPGEAWHSPGPASAPDQLWDPWLDSGRDVQAGAAELAAGPSDHSEPWAPVDAVAGLEIRQALVRPRVISPVTGEAIPLDDKIGQLIAEGRHHTVGIIGGPGSGKTTALRHLAAILPPWALDHVRFFDDRQADIVTLGDRNCHLVIWAGNRVDTAISQVVYSLASWGQDDLIEYLLSAHWDRCSSVMARLKGSNGHSFLKGIPELWAVSLDRMARDESIVDVRAAIRCELAESLDGNPRSRTVVEDFCLSGIATADQDHNSALELPTSLLDDDSPAHAERTVHLARLIRHRPVALLLAADRIKDIAERGCVEPAFARRFPHDLVEEAALRITANTLAINHLGEWLDVADHRNVHPMAASLLHAAVPKWRPSPHCRPRLTGAYLAGAVWPGLDLSKLNLESADLSAADLSRVNLKQSLASRARFARANFHEAILDSWIAVDADLSGANLRSVQAVDANFCQADLTGARLVEANLSKANLRDAKIENADFTGANLDNARLSGLKLRLARFDYARFGGADLRGCDLEEIVLTVPDFHNADLRRALLTGSRMEEANFVGADLRGAGLAEIDWPGADLRNADLRDASFHLGSSRSGLVGSPIACEGSRTGFYTDDYDDQAVKSAEEIRKANLCGADLCGANIENVDFYLVDLRGAKFTPDQAKHFRQCRAILERQY